MLCRKITVDEHFLKYSGCESKLHSKSSFFANLLMSFNFSSSFWACLNAMSCCYAIGLLDIRIDKQAGKCIFVLAADCFCALNGTVVQPCIICALISIVWPFAVPVSWFARFPLLFQKNEKEFKVLTCPPNSPKKGIKNISPWFVFFISYRQPSFAFNNLFLTQPRTK